MTWSRVATPQIYLHRREITRQGVNPSGTILFNPLITKAITGTRETEEYFGDNILSLVTHTNYVNSNLEQFNCYINLIKDYNNNGYNGCMY